jgi:outer membrane lipoprotein SlyB
MKRAFPRSAVALAVLLAFAVACARKPDDTKISSEIQSKFSQDSGLSTKQLTVESNNGVVTLSGTVDNSAQRDAASRQAAAVAGVKEVVNNLQVGDALAATLAPTTMRASSSAPSPEAAKPSPSAKPAVTRKPRKSKDDAMPADPPPANDADPNANSTNASAAPADPPPPASSPDNQPSNAPAADTQTQPPAPKQLIVDQGTQVTVRLIDPIDSEKNQTGDTFRATLNATLTSDGEEAVPAGVELTGHLVDVKSAGKFAGQSQVVLQLDSIAYGGKTYTIQTDQYRKQAASRGKNTAEKVGGGAILGGIIGAIAGGGKGAAIGTAAGAGVGGGVQAATKSQQIKLPSETVLNFTLQAPVTVTQPSKQDNNRPKLGDQQ